MFRIVCLLSGRGSNFQAILKNTKNGFLEAQIVCVISDKENARGLEIARQNNIDAIFVNPKSLSQKEYAKKLIAIVDTYKPDLIVLAGFMRILEEEFVNHYLGKIVNIHPSLLPLFKGLHPQEQALEANVMISGATVHFVTNDLDNGPIIIQAAVPVSQNDTQDTLAERILKVEHKIYSMAIKMIIDKQVYFDKNKAIFSNVRFLDNFIINPTLEV